MIDTIAPHVKTEYQTIEDVIESLSQLETVFRSTKDNRGLFVIAYKDMTLQLQEAIGSQQSGRTKLFHDLGWIKAYLLNFANLYREALQGSLQATAVPEAWRIAFEKAHDDRGVISLQHLMLGINAHIAHDLPLALHRAGFGTGLQQKQRKEDHDAVNNILKATTNTIQNKVTRFHLSQGFSLLEKVIGPFDEWIAQIYFKQQRERAWYNGRHLSCLANGESVDSFTDEWFRWALQSNEKISGFDQLLKQIDLRAFTLAGYMIKWKLPKIPGFKEDTFLDEFEQELTETELEQLAEELQQQREGSQTVGDWTEII